MHPLIASKVAEIQRVNIGMFIFYRHNTEIRRWLVFNWKSIQAPGLLPMTHYAVIWLSISCILYFLADLYGDAFSNANIAIQNVIFKELFCETQKLTTRKETVGDFLCSYKFSLFKNGMKNPAGKIFYNILTPFLISDGE